MGGETKLFLVLYDKYSSFILNTSQDSTAILTRQDAEA